MKKAVVSATFAILAAVSTVALSGTKTVTLSVSGMSCPGCAITVKKSLTRVEGVSDAKVSFEKSEALVTFDDAKTSVDALLKATGNAGYPSTIKK